MKLKKINQKDQLDLKKLYFDAIISINDSIYSQEQKIAWASQAWENKNFDLAIKEGKGWLIKNNEKSIAFATRYPNNRIALFYCKGDSQRKGYGTILLHKLENEAKEEGLPSLSTEASLLSYELFIKNDWAIIRKEKIFIKNIMFERYKMIKNF